MLELFTFQKTGSAEWSLLILTVLADVAFINLFIKTIFKPHCLEKSVPTCKIQVLNFLCCFLEEETLCLMTNSSEAKQGRGSLTKTIKAADMVEDC